MRKLILMSVFLSMFLVGCSAKIYDTSHKLYDKYSPTVKKLKNLNNIRKGK